MLGFAVSGGSAAYAQEWQPSRQTTPNRLPTSANVKHISKAQPSSTATAQSTQSATVSQGNVAWQPTRGRIQPQGSQAIPASSTAPANANAQPLQSAASVQATSRAASDQQQGNALRWKKPDNFSAAQPLAATNPSDATNQASPLPATNYAPADNAVRMASYGQPDVAAHHNVPAAGQSTQRSVAIPNSDNNPNGRVRVAAMSRVTNNGMAGSPTTATHAEPTQRFTAHDAFGSNPLRGAEPKFATERGRVQSTNGSVRNATANGSSQPQNPVQLANYQITDSSSDPFSDAFSMPEAPSAFGQEAEIVQPSQAFGLDLPPNEMEQVETPPAPSSTLQSGDAFGQGDAFQDSSNGGAAPEPNGAEPENPFDRMNAAQEEEDSPSNAFGEAEIVPSPAPEDEDDFSMERGGSGSIECNELRERIRARPLSNVSLDVSPSFGEGLRSVRNSSELEKQEFAANSRIRDWHDYRNMFLFSGRLVDLKDDRVVLNINGALQKVRLQDLSDVDLAYVGQAWNIPLHCGTGNEPFNGRNFVASTVQWKAPGHCHKPLYFEQTQLERYGHEAGPILQPIVSTAHFFANIAVLPYKMGIHPPNECQYSLGYYRPGNCAPYMIQPIPLSLKGAAAQAGFVLGGGALVP